MLLPDFGKAAALLGMRGAFKIFKCGRLSRKHKMNSLLHHGRQFFCFKQKRIGTKYLERQKYSVRFIRQVR